MISAIVTDIEGTTSSISFVHDVLFPYAREHIRAFLVSNAEGRAAPHIEDARRAVGRPELPLDQVADQLIQWIEEDKKITPLKALQGMVWEQGFKNGDFTGHVYRDAVDCLRDWHHRGLKIYVYSSGSIFAQKLLFGFSDFGDLRPLFRGYFDTTTGAKVDAGAYRKITAAINLPANEILFLSDVEKELDAARTAGLQTRWLVREGRLNPKASHRQVASFRDIDFSVM
ncbi:MAG: acireductone synthase [Methylococcaceae bacterium]|nr:acireductone synthase [Methylococcaceae bacterium]MCI0732392.1 acireductone synthase [Methylococcaceae bacterium]